MSFEPAAKKFRPQKFCEVLDQPATVRILQNAIRLNRIPGAIVFSGQRGTGKTTLARLVATTMNCDTTEAQRKSGLTVEPCLQCVSCINIRQNTDSEVIEIDASSNRGIDDARELQKIAQQEPKKGKWRIIIIDECFVAGTLVDGRPIEQVQVGDEVRSYDEVTNTFCNRRVTRLYKSKSSSLCRVIVAGKVIVCTTNHPFFTDRGWVKASKITNEDRIRTCLEEVGSSGWSRVDNVEILESRDSDEFRSVCPDGYVYNLEVEGTHTYLVENLVVHNCHGLTKEAQNSLLALFESPPRAFLPILCTTELDKILPTIVSRCTKFIIKPLSREAVKKNVQMIFADANQQIEDSALDALVRTSQGSLRDIQQVADQLISSACGELITNEFLEEVAGIPTLVAYRRVVGTLMIAWEEGPAEWYAMIEDMANRGADLYQLFFTILVNLMRDMRVAIASRGLSEPVVPYWTGISHEAFEARMTLQHEDLDLMLQAWETVSHNFRMSNTMTNRANAEMWFLFAWDSKRAGAVAKVV
jgi:DNA polymerase III gamma/tau subunit